jgi:hypothetical protein
LLRTALEIYPGLNWVSIANHLNNKFTASQCNQHYNRVVNPNLRRNTKWGSTEEKKLVELYEMYGSRWSLISRELDGRSDTQCRRIF